METTDGALEDNRACWRRTSRGLADVHLGAVEGSDAVILSARDVVASTPRTTLMRVGRSREVPVRVAPTPTAAIVGRLKSGKEVAVETYDEGAWVRLSPFDPFALRVARDPSAARPDARERALAPDGGLWVLADETLSAVSTDMTAASDASNEGGTPPRSLPDCSICDVCSEAMGPLLGEDGDGESVGSADDVEMV